MMSSRSSRTVLRIVLSTLLLIAVLSVAFAEQPLFRFVQISDTQPRNEDMWANTAKAVEVINNLQPQPAFVLFAGDLTDWGAPADAERLVAICANLQAPLYPVPGNHDFPMVRTHDWQKYFAPERWSMRYGNFKFVGFYTGNEMVMDLGGPDFEAQLDQELGDPTTPNRWVVGHHAIWDYTAESEISDPWLQELFDKHKVIAYSHGHFHDVRHGYPPGSNTLHVCSGTEYDDSGNAGFLYVDVYPLQAKIFKCNLQGEVKELRTIALAAEAKLPGPTPMKPWPGAVEMEALLVP